MRKIILPIDPRLRPGVIPGVLGVGSGHRQHPDPVVALRNQIEAAPNAAERNRVRLKLADLLHSTGYKTEALAELNAIANCRFIRSDWLLQSRQRVCPSRRFEAAMTSYRTAIEQRKGNYSRAYNNLGVLLLRAGRWDEAHEALLSALKP